MQCDFQTRLHSSPFRVSQETNVMEEAEGRSSTQNSRTTQKPPQLIFKRCAHLSL